MTSNFKYNSKSHQPDRPRSKRQRNIILLRNSKHHIKLFYYFLRGLPKALLRYRKNLQSLFPVNLNIPKGFCLSTDNEPALLDNIREDVKELKPDSLLVRMPVWTLGHIDNTRDFIRDTVHNNTDVIVQVIQGPESVKEHDKWEDDLSRIFECLAPYCSHYIIGHAWNRVKWGIESVEGYLGLFETAYRLKNEAFPGIKLIGPSVIDFEYINTLGCLNHKRKPRFDIVNQLLYVDRRGAPENRQNGFDLAHKCLLFRSIIDSTLGTHIPFWITETNYPLITDRKEYCPTSQKEAVDEDLYASFMVRYYLIALSSGCAERVYWWQIAAHGYGLIDNFEKIWRKRKAYHAFIFLRSMLSGSTFIKREMNKHYHLFRFLTDENNCFSVAWALDGNCPCSPDLPVREVLNIIGETQPKCNTILSQSPVYLLH